MKGDPCREDSLPDTVLPPIPADELARATIGGTPASELPLDVVRIFRGDNWTSEMLHYVADEINRRVTG
jgi:hypothetical protein